MQVLACAPIIGFRTEIRHVDYEGITLPMAARVAKPLADVSRQMGAPVHDNISLPALPLTHVIEHRDAARRLHDPAKAPAECGSKLGQPARQAALRQTAVVRTIIAVHAHGGVARRKVYASRGRRWVILTTATARRLVFCTSRSIATERDGIHGRRRELSAPPASAAESGRRVDRQPATCAPR